MTIIHYELLYENNAAKKYVGCRFWEGEKFSGSWTWDYRDHELLEDLKKDKISSDRIFYSLGFLFNVYHLNFALKFIKRKTKQAGFEFKGMETSIDVRQNLSEKYTFELIDENQHLMWKLSR